MNFRTHLRTVGLSLASAAVVVSGLAASTQANASTVADTSKTVASVATVQTQNHDHDRWHYRGTYDDRRDCHRAGERGERRDWWDDYRCREVRDRNHNDRHHDHDYDYELWVRY
jgi:hypothetical protein